MLKFIRISLIIMLATSLGAAHAATAEATPWSPPEPNPKSKDWVRLSSGEWVRGTIELLQDDKLSFDSEEMDDLEFDWVDVVEIRSPRILTVGLVDGTVLTGTVGMRDGILKVRNQDGVREFEKSHVLAMIAGRPTELNYWSMKVTASMVSRSGNTEQFDFTSTVRLRRQTTRSQFNLQYLGNYGKTSDEKTVDNISIDAKANLFLSRKLFVTPASIDLYTDEFQNLDLRAGIGAGFGYYLIRNKTDWQINASGGYQRTDYISVAEGENPDVGNGTTTVGTTLEMDLTKDIELDFQYNVRRSFGEDATTVHHAYLMLSFDIFGDIIDFNASATWDHNSAPKANADGVTPKKDDLTMAYGLGIDF